MPPKKNKPSKNGFWQFVMECRDKPQNRNLNMEEVKNYADRKWRNMTKEERSPYEGRAVFEKNNATRVKYTSEGIPVEEIERQEKDSANKKAAMRREIDNTIKEATLSDSLANQVFLVIHVNNLAYYPPEDKFFICEIAIAPFCLRFGAKMNDIFHKVVKPGRLPLGYYGAALTQSKETHQLVELTQAEPLEENTMEVWQEMLIFMRKFSKDKQLPILYAPEAIMEVVNKTMENFCQEFNFRENIKVYNLQYMFYSLRNAAAGRQIWQTETMSYREIEDDIYSHCPKISCEFHELSDNCVFCSRSIAIRSVYIICDHCTVDLKIRLRPGFHVPLNAKVEETLTKNDVTSSLSTLVGDEDDEDEDEDNMSQFRPDTRASVLSDDHFPALGSRSSASSMVSSMSSVRGRRNPWGGRPDPSLADSFSTQLSVSSQQRRRNYRGLNFPDRRSGPTNDPK